MCLGLSLYPKVIVRREEKVMLELELRKVDRLNSYLEVAP